MSEPFDVNAYLRCDCASVANQTCDKCAVRAHIATLRDALTPFRDYGEWATDENGWLNKAGNGRISDWFGPSDFYRAYSAIGPATVDAPQG